MSMYDDFTDIVVGEEEVSCQAVLDVLKEHCGTISIFDLMAVNAEMIEESKYVQENYKDKSHGVYAKYFLGRIKEIRDDNTNYNRNIDKEDFIDSVATLKSYHDNESLISKTKFPLSGLLFRDHLKSRKRMEFTIVL